jgi:hypothetical protein
VSSALALAGQLAGQLNAITNDTTLTAAEVELAAAVRQTLLSTVLSIVDSAAAVANSSNVTTDDGTGSGAGGDGTAGDLILKRPSIATQNETVAEEAITNVAAIVAEPEQNTVIAQDLASAFLDRELGALAQQSAADGNTTSNVSALASPLSDTTLDSAASATSALIESVYQAAMSTSSNGSVTDALAAKIGARLSSGASALSIVQLRGKDIGDPPVTRKQPRLTVMSQRHSSAAFCGGDSNEGSAAAPGTTLLTSGSVSFSLPPLRSSGVECDSEAATDTAMVVWELSPWSFEAGRVDSFVAGLTLTVPADQNREVEVDLSSSGTAGAAAGSEIRILIPRQRADETDSVVDECIYLDDANPSSRVWSPGGCRVDSARTNRTHVVCACTHLTDFAARLGASFGSIGRVVGQLSSKRSSRTSLGQTVQQNLGTILVIIGLGVVFVTFGVLGNLKERRNQQDKNKHVHALARRLSAVGSRRVSQMVREGGTAAKQDDILEPTTPDSRSASMHHVIESLCREFWSDGHLAKLRELDKKTQAPDEGAHVARVHRVSCGARLWHRFKARVRMEHEWIAPFLLTAENKFFTPGARVVLLALVILTQMATDAILFDLRHPETQGTCALVYTNASFQNLTMNVTTVTLNETSPDGTTVNVSSTSNVTDEQSAADSMTNFPLAQGLDAQEKLAIAVVSCLLTVPISAMCFAALIKLAQAKKNSHLWARFGTSQLRAELAVRVFSLQHSAFRRKETDGGADSAVCLVACGGVAYVCEEEGHTSLTLTCATTIAVIAGEISDAAQKREARDPVALKNFVVALENPTARFECRTEAEAQALGRALQTTVNELPLHKTAAKAARAASRARRAHLQRFRRKYEHQSAQDRRLNPSPLRSHEQWVDFDALERLSVGLAEHGARQHDVVLQLERHSNHENTTAAAATTSGDRNTGPPLFTQDEPSFQRAIRRRMVPKEELAREDEEDRAGSLIESCFCKLLFAQLVVADRLEITADPDTKKAWCLQVGMVLLSVGCGIYVILFGFCHGQDVTFGWMESLALQITLSALLFRPATILLMSAILPAATIEAGWANFQAERGATVRDDRTQQAQEVAVTVELAPILAGRADAYREVPGSLLAL